MVNPEINLSEERISEIHQIVQEAKAPPGWGWFLYLMKGNITGRILPESEVIGEIGKSIGLDVMENAQFEIYTTFRLSDLIWEDFANNNPILPQLMKALNQPLVDSRRQALERKIGEAEVKFAHAYEDITGLSADICRRQLNTVSRFGQVISSTLYQPEMDPQSTIRIISSWRNTILESRAAVGYNPVYD